MPDNILVGEKYGKLLILNILDNNCECLCKCGRRKTISKHDILIGHDKSCGECRKINNHEIIDNYILVYLDNGNNFIIDIENWDIIKEYKWRENDEGYIYSSPNNKKIYVHRIIMGLNNYKIDKITVDHINRNKKDNRKENLRLATKVQNKRNGNIRKDNISGIIGVHIYKPYNKYHSFIAINTMDKHLGYFDSFEDAIIARLKAEKFYFGEFAPQIHLFEQYGII